MVRWPLLLLWLFFLAACQHPAPQPVPPDADAASPPSCVTACANLRALGCPEAMGAPDGSAPCELACTHIRDTKLAKLDIACITLAKSVDEVHACNVRCAP